MRAMLTAVTMGLLAMMIVTTSNIHGSISTMVDEARYTVEALGSEIARRRP